MNTGLQLFVNGVREASTSINVVRHTNSNPLTIGWNAVFPGRFFRGRIDQVRIFDGAPSADTVAHVFYTESGSWSPHQVVALQLLSTNAIITVASVADYTYQLQQRDSLIAGIWSDILGVSNKSNGGFLAVTNFGGALLPRCFYRCPISP